MAARTRALSVEGILVRDKGLVSQYPPEGVDFLRGLLGQVGQGAFPDIAVFAPALARTNGGELRLEKVSICKVTHAQHSNPLSSSE